MQHLRGHPLLALLVTIDLALSKYSFHQVLSLYTLLIFSSLAVVVIFRSFSPILVSGSLKSSSKYEFRMNEWDRRFGY